jgi:hypothetical protein
VVTRRRRDELRRQAVRPFEARDTALNAPRDLKEFETCRTRASADFSARVIRHHADGMSGVRRTRGNPPPRPHHVNEGHWRPVSGAARECPRAAG